MSVRAIEQAQTVLENWGMQQARVQPITLGHINQTFRVDFGTQSYILQQLSSIFVPEVNYDIEVVTQHVAQSGLITPLLVRCADGAAFCFDENKRPWRMLTYIPGRCFERALGPGMVQSAGVLLGRFHRALGTLNHVFLAPRTGVHDTQRHLERLAMALQVHRSHPAYPSIAPLAEKIFALAKTLDLNSAALPSRIVHGDPKISNIIFADEGLALSLVDLDTLGHMAITDELGDALRSWCNQSGESPEGSRFDVTLLDAALRGYCAGADGLLAPDEIEALCEAPLKISLELTARFARDALEETYFGWDQDKYQASWQHQLDRAKSQWSVANSSQAQKHQIAQSVARAFG